ncbi:MAG: acyltransferase family protein, partial [Alphaproteobacteria bacterium]|nr:acyltransferase family protein [Alphaproteobacteria bacterium]
MARMGTDSGHFAPGDRAGPSRVDWVDYAKGFCIVMVVMMHSTLGVEAAAGHESWMHAVVAFAKPFRMPDFFMISGLFLARVIDRDWRTYLDRKVVHFAYFYVLWVTIQFCFKAPGLAAENGALGVARLYAESFIEPFGTLWFIYLLPIFFVVTKLTRGVPVLVVWTVLAALEIAHVETGWTVIDEFCNRFVYFYTGYILAARIFEIAATAQARPWIAAIYLFGWAALDAALVRHGLDGKPFVSLGLGLIGAVAVVTISALIATSDMFAPLRYLGRNSIVVYLAFFLGMAGARTLLLKTGLIPDLGTVALIVTASGIAVAVALFWAVRATPARFLFERPG